MYTLHIRTDCTLIFIPRASLLNPYELKTGFVDHVLSRLLEGNDNKKKMLKNPFLQSAFNLS